MCNQQSRPRRRQRSDPALTFAAIAADACKIDNHQNISIVSVGPAEAGDPTLLFLRSDGETRAMLAVAPDLIRSKRLRGRRATRDHAVERGYEMMRLQEAVTPNDDPADDRF